MPSFGKIVIYSKFIKKNKNLKEYKQSKITLRANKYAYKSNFSLNIVKIQLSRIFQKRVSLSGFSCIKAGMTVEASLVFPIFLFAVLNLLSVLEFIRLQSNLESALHQTGKKMAVYAHAYDKTGLELEKYPLSSVLFGITYVKGNVEKYVGKPYLDHTVLKYGRKGINYTYSKIMEDDRIDLVALYDVNGLFSYKGMRGIPLYNRFYGHVWTGYDVEQQKEAGEEDIYVFITKTGTVYHRNRNCTYLNPSVNAVYYEDLEENRNENGAIYYACELCGEGERTVVYITKQGNRYHTTLQCSGLKRTVYSILLSETGGRAPCSKCGQ